VALIGNQSVLAKTPGRMLGGNSSTTVALGGPGALLSGVAKQRPGWYKSGPARARFTGEGGWYAQSAVPDGYRPPYTFNIAQKPGALAFHTYGQGTTSNVAGILAGGKNAVAGLAGTGTISSAPLQLTVNAAATITAGGTLTADVVGKLEAIAALSGSGTLAAPIEAQANLLANLAGSGNMTATVRADGNIAADILPYTELSPQSLAQAVWTLQAAGFLPGTFGAYNSVPAGGLTAQEVRDALALATAETPEAGSLDDQLEKIKAETGLIPASI
jgi:hypothetical protein